MRPETMSCKDKLIGDLRAHREALGWSVKEVEDRTGLDETVIAQWERGDASPRLEAVANWASAFGLTLSLTAGRGRGAARAARRLGGPAHQRRRHPGPADADGVEGARTPRRVAR